jgi:hypothetical protein
MSRDVGDHGDFAALCLRPSADNPHPGVAVLLQTKGESPFDSLMTALSKLFFAFFWGCFC